MQALTERQRRAALTGAIGSVTIVGLGLSLTVPLLSLEMERMGISKFWIGANTATAGLASLVVVPFVPRLAMRFGVMPLLIGSVLVLTFTFPLFKAIYSFPFWFPLRFVCAASLGTLFVLSEYWISAAAPPERRGLVMGIYATVLAAGFALGPALLSVVGTSGWPPYIAGTILFLLGVVPLLAAREVSPEIEEGGSRTILSFLLAAPAATLAALVYGMVETGGFALLPIYGLAYGFTAEGGAFLVSVLSIGNILFQVPVGMLADRVDRRVVLLACAGIGVLGAVLIPPTIGNAYLFYPLLTVWGGVVGGLYTVGLAHLGARFTGAELAKANAAFVILYNVGLMAGPPLIGLGMDVAPDGFAYTIGAFLAAYVLVVLARLRQPGS
jgi:MFS family permease